MNKEAYAKINAFYHDCDETARKLTEAACTGSHVIANHEYGGYVLFIGDIDPEWDGLYMGGFDMDYEDLERNVRQYSYQYLDC